MKLTKVEEIAKALGISRRALTYKIQYLKEAGYQTDPAWQALRKVGLALEFQMLF